MNNMTTFDSARLKLTAWYLVIIMLICALFSFGIYGFVNQTFNRLEDVYQFRQEKGGEDFIKAIEKLADERVAKGLPMPEEPPKELFSSTSESIAQARSQFIITLVTINVAILGISGFIGYFLAGRTLKPIKEMMDEQNRFITDASHELKTPLTSLRTEFEVAMMEEDISKQESKKLIKSSFEEIVRLQGLAENLIELTHLKKGKGTLAKEEVGLLNVIEEALKKVVPMAKQKQIIIDNQVEDYVIQGDYHSLCEVFVILLDNAIKYSSNKTEITVNSHSLDHHVLVKVTDHGSGISQKDLPHIFSRFYRADKSRSTSGYGLGLSIAKEIVVRHKGAIEVESVQNEGTTFTVKLPILDTA